MDMQTTMMYMYFRYIPNKPTAYVALAVFVLIAIYLILRIKLQKAPAFMYKLVFFAILETLGFVLRIVCFFTNINQAKFLVMTLFTLVGPNVMILVSYNAITHMIRLSNLTTERKYLDPKKLKIASIFFTAAPSMLQGVGGIIQLVAPQIRQKGINIALAGLSFQILVFFIFALCLIYIYQEKSISYQMEDVRNPKKMVLLRASLGLFLLSVRVIYRLVQFATGGTSYAATHEWTFYVFDVLLVAITFLILSTFNSCFPKNGEEGFEQKDEEKIEINESKGSLE